MMISRFVSVLFCAVAATAAHAQTDPNTRSAAIHDGLAALGADA